MVFSLELHSSHHNQPEQVLMFVITAGDNLVIDECHLRVLLETYLLLVVADQDVSRIETCQQLTENEVDEVSTEVVQTKIV